MCGSWSLHQGTIILMIQDVWLLEENLELIEEGTFGTMQATNVLFHNT